MAAYWSAGLLVDNWLPTGPLIEVLGEMGTRLMGIQKHARVAAAANATEWKLRRCRGHQLQQLVTLIRTVPLPQPEAGKDQVLWKQKTGDYQPRFNACSTWDILRQDRPTVDWHSLVWFPQAVPRQAFITWLAFKNRLATGNMTKIWGDNQPCLMCGDPEETRDHLFFACPFSYAVWTSLLTPIIGSRIHHVWLTTINQLKGNMLSQTDSLLTRMTFQTTIYWLWRERNGRRHQRLSSTPQTLARTIHKEVLLRLYSLRRLPHEEEDEEVINQWLQISS